MTAFAYNESALPAMVDFVDNGTSYSETNWDDIFRTTQTSLWAVIDGVNCAEVSQRLSSSTVQNVCLYTTTDPGTEASAPWLVRLESDSETVKWLKRLPHDQHWGIVFQSKATLKDLRAHLRKFTMLWTPADEYAPVYFRFYDPRVAVDMAQALEPWKLGRFMAPIERIFAPLSPLMVTPQRLELNPPLTLETDAADCQRRFVSISISDAHREDTPTAKSFSISQLEFDRFGVLQKIKANKKMARDMKPAYPDHTSEIILRAVERAAAIGQTHGMISRKQTRTLAKCVLEFGDDFQNRFPGIEKTIRNTNIAAWRRRDIIEEWMPLGISTFKKEAARR